MDSYCNDTLVKGLPWINCITIVGFHLEEGQVLEFVYPEKSIPNECLEQVKYLAMPDSNSSSVEDSFFVFKLRNSAENRSLITKESDYFFGYTLFRRRKDETISRGYFQKSVTIISMLPIYKFYRQ